MNPVRKFRTGDFVKIVQIPDDLTDAVGIGTPEVFRRSLGKTFRIEGFDRYGHIELVVSRRDTIWIEPKFVMRVAKCLAGNHSVDDQI